MSTWERIKERRVSLVLVSILVILVLVLFMYSKMKRDRANDRNRSDKAYYESLILDNPRPLQDMFAKRITDGGKSGISQSEAYFVTHRFFDNGGNIYEIYDYINSHPQLAFLKEAERIYPQIFAQIENRTLPIWITRRGRYAYIAYMEVLDKYGYAGPATWATLANQHARFAWLVQKHPEQFTLNPSTAGIDLDEYFKWHSEKATYYATKTRDSAVQTLDDEDLSDTPPRDIVVMLNQYASTLRYLESLGIPFASPKGADEVFDFVTNYARQYTPEFYVWSGFLNASTINILSPHRRIAMEEALQPLLEIEVSDTFMEKPNATAKIISAKSLEYESFPGTNVKQHNFEVYDKPNIVSLAKSVPKFKEWLLRNGWEESDFVGWE